MRLLPGTLALFWWLDDDPKLSDDGDMPLYSHLGLKLAPCR